VIPIRGQGNDVGLFTVHTIGRANFEHAQNHFVAIYCREGVGWREVARQELACDLLDSNGVREVKVTSGRTWIEVHGGAGAHGSCYDLLSFDGKNIRDEVSASSGELRDLNRDGTPEVVLDETEHYVFCYACGVTIPNFKVLRWDGAQFVEVHLARMPDSAPVETRRLTNQAIDLVEGGFWKEARETIIQTQALDSKNPAIAWDAALILLHAEARAEQAKSGVYPLLDNVIYGDYASALDALRPYTAAQIFDLNGPVIAGTPAEGFEERLISEVTRTATQALRTRPDLAAAYYLRGWGTYLREHSNPAALANVERAARLAPDEQLFLEGVAQLRK